MLRNKKFKTLILHTAHEGVQRDFIYELLTPMTFNAVQAEVNRVTASMSDDNFIGFETTQGISSFRGWTITGFDLEDPV